jgi:type II secretory pathway pseudopilin PulG
MKSQRGFTLIEVVLFIIITSILVKTLFLTFSNTLTDMPDTHNDLVASQSARHCIEWFIGQRRLLGYSSVTSPSTTVPSFCTQPTGYNLAVSVVNTTLNSDANYKTVTVTVSGKGDAVSSVLLANY